MAEEIHKKRGRGSSIEIIDLESPKSSIWDAIDLTTTYDDDDDDDEIMEIKSFRSMKNPISGVKVIEIGDCSGSNKKKTKRVEESFVCDICVETKMINEAFEIKGCPHSYCSECIVRYVASKIQENVISIGCPEMNCQGVLEPEHCKSILPPEVFHRWGRAQCEALILGEQVFYCPFKDCSAPLLVDEGQGGIVQSECPHCNRSFCAQCKVPWHAGIVCAEFQKLDVDERGREDIMLMEVAKKKGWKRCPKCKFYVEKKSGCSAIRCRCGESFDYYSGRSRGYVGNVNRRRLILQMANQAPFNYTSGFPSYLPLVAHNLAGSIQQRRSIQQVDNSVPDRSFQNIHQTHQMANPEPFNYNIGRSSNHFNIFSGHPYQNIQHPSAP